MSVTPNLCCDETKNQLRSIHSPDRTELSECLEELSFFLSFFFLPHSMWDLNSLAGDQTCTPEVEVQSLNHWTAREVSYRILYT